MSDKAEKTGLFQGQSMNFYSTGSEIASRENMRLMPPNNGPDRPYMDEASRKRKAVDSDFVSTICDSASTRAWPQPSGNTGHLLPRESSSQHHVLTINTQQKSTEIFPNIYSHIAKPINEQSECGDYQFYDLNNSLMSFRRRDGNFQESVVDGLHHKVPSFSINTPAVGIPNLPGAGNYRHDIGRHPEASKFQSYYNQSSNCVEKMPADLTSSRGMGIGMNPGLGNNNQPYIRPPPQILSSRDLTFLGPSQSNTVNVDYIQDSVYAQDLSKRGLVEAKKTGQNVVPAENNLSIHTMNSCQTSIDERKEIWGSYQYSDTETRSSNYTHNHSLSAHLNVRDGDMLQLPAFSEIFGREETCLENGSTQYSPLVCKDPGTKSVQKDDRSSDGNKCESLGEGTSSKTEDLPSLNFDKQSKSSAPRISLVTVEKLWDGSLQLNTSTTVSAVAFFKSGEKAQDINWSEHLEVKGKVRLQAFEKFIQELPRSRNRTLMVISLCWKIGSSRVGLAGMKEVARGYRESERVGFAQICPGYDLYVCPRSDAIITILAKHGFFQGISEVEEDQDSLIGCIVWRRSPPSLNPVPQNSDRKNPTIPKHSVNSPESSAIQANSPLLKVLDSESKQAIQCTREPDCIRNEVMSDNRSSDLDNSVHMSESTGIHLNNDLHDASGQTTDIAPETAPMYVSSTPIELCAVPQPEPTSLQGIMAQDETTTMKIAEPPKGPDLSSEPAHPVLPGSPPKLPKTQQSRESSKDMHNLSRVHTGPLPELNPFISFNSLCKQTEPSETHWSNSNSQVNPTMLGSPITHTAELKKPDMHFGLTRPIFPGSTQLLPEILRRITGSSRDVHQDTVKGTETSKTSMGLERTEQILPRAPESLPPAQQKSVGPDEDDLPEFDFSSACGVLEAPVNKLYWPAHEYHFPEAPKFDKQLPNEVVKNVDGGLPPAVPVPKWNEVMQISPATSFPEKPSNTYQAINMSTKFGELDSKSKLEYQSSQSLSRPISMKDEKGPASPRSSNSFPRKNRWEDDDDMPEWCPPDLEHLDHRQPKRTAGQLSPVPKPTADNSAPQPPFPTQSLTSFHQSQNHGILHRYQPGLLVHSPAASAQTRPVAGVARSEMRYPTVPNQNQFLRPPVRNFDNMSPADVNWRWPRH